MKYLKIVFVLSMMMYTQGLSAQDITTQTIGGHLKYLSSDELMGRMTGSEGNNKAAAYIAEHFKKLGLKAPEGAEDYYQPVYLKKSFPTTGNTLTLAGEELEEKTEMVFLRGGELDLSSEVVFVNYGWVDEANGRDDYEGLDVKGKIVIAKMGMAEDSDPREGLRILRDKRLIAAEKGAKALIEIYNAPLPWKFLVNYFTQPSYSLDEPDSKEDVKDDFVYIWVKEDENEKFTKMVEEDKALKASLSSKGTKFEAVKSQNVIAMLEGTDPELKKEYVFLTAHYDHVGGGKNTGSGGPQTPEDSIYNGARDNAMGTTAVLSAASYFAKNPPKKSLVFMTYTGEELGLLGSQYYSEKPLIPFEQVAYNLNCDGAGYNDKSKITVIGLERTTAMNMIKEACQEQGVEAIMDPVPEQGLFDRSDNVNFAVHGVPAPTFAPGLTAFDQEIQKYYHNVADEFESVDLDYFLKYVKAYIGAAQRISDFKGELKWVEGDKYEKAYEHLHKK